MLLQGYLGIDNGTQGLTVLFTNLDLKVLGTGEATYRCLPDLPDGCYEQVAADWDRALQQAMQELRKSLATKYQHQNDTIVLHILAIGISGQMHGEVLVNAANEPLQPVRLWCDARNEETGHTLTQAFQTKVPKRATAARFLWTVKHRPVAASQTKHLTTPAGWMAFRLTGEWNLGVGDAAGMFPVDAATGTFHQEHLATFDKLVKQQHDNDNEEHIIPSLKSILPHIRKAGQDAGTVNDAGATLLGLTVEERAHPIPVAAAEGDQVAALAGSLIGHTGTLSCCFGTSVCANMVGDAAAQPFAGVSPAVDHFCAADGKPIHMVWLRNGTTFLNTVVESYSGGDFGSMMPQLLEAPPDCQGLLAMPFMDDEPGLSVARGGTALFVGWNSENAKPGNVAKAALLSVLYNLKLGCGVLSEQQGSQACTEIVLTGGLAKTPATGQIVADVFDTPVSLLESADEGSCWGAAVLAKYRHYCATATTVDDDNGETPPMPWTAFLESIRASRPTSNRRYEPDPNAVPIYQAHFARYRALLALQPQLDRVMNG